ncbi:MAG TPA: NAD(P)-dependent oxidoreductase [bacterium]|nr:NAD(P)-dependent oxidoreductase [bacterium]
MILPLHVDFKRLPVLVVGGGLGAIRWVYLLIEAGARVKVFASELSFELRDLAKAKRLTWVRRPFRIADFAAVALVVAAAEDSALNRRVVRTARAKKLWVVSTDEKSPGNACLPSSLRRGELLIHFALPGGMRSHPVDGELIAFLRRRLGRSFGREWELVWEQLKAWKGGGALKERLSAWLKAAKKKRIYKKTL